MKHVTEIFWKGDMLFEALIDGHSVVMDASVEGGGSDSGPSPKKLMLTALAGCSGMDVVSILKKMRVEISDVKISVEGEVTEDHPKHYTSMHMIYQFKGNHPDPEKLTRAVELSQEKYCGVAAAYKKAMKITYEIRIED